MKVYNCTADYYELESKMHSFIDKHKYKTEDLIVIFYERDGSNEKNAISHINRIVKDNDRKSELIKHLRCMYILGFHTIIEGNISLIVIKTTDFEVFLHEFGHYISSKIRVEQDEEFAIWFSKYGDKVYGQESISERDDSRNY